MGSTSRTAPIVEQIFQGRPPQNRRQRYFVELGAADGLRISNTLALEQRFGWHGLCIEPSLAYAQLVMSNRTCVKRGEAVSGRSGDIVNFLDQTLADPTSDVREPAGREPAGRLDPVTAPPSAEGLYSGITSWMSTYRVAGAATKKVTRTLADILDESSFPKHVDFLSLDTEGSELDILSTFPFDRRSFGAVLVEHNHEALRRRDLRLLLESKGYVRVRCIESDDLFVSLKVLSDYDIRVDPRQCYTIMFEFTCQVRYNTPAGRGACRSGQNGGPLMRHYAKREVAIEPWLQPHLDHMTNAQNIGTLCGVLLGVCDRRGWTHASGTEMTYQVPASSDLDAPGLMMRFDSTTFPYKFATSLHVRNASLDIGMPALCMEHGVDAATCANMSRSLEMFVDKFLVERTEQEVARISAAFQGV
jgi:hypothetical protein